MVTFWTTFGCHFGADGPGVIFTAGLGVIVTSWRLGLIRPYVAPDACPRIRPQTVNVSRAQMGPSGMVWESSATGLGTTGQPKSQANRKALQGPYKAL